MRILRKDMKGGKYLKGGKGEKDIGEGKSGKLTKESADYMRKVGKYIKMLDEKGEMKEEMSEEMKKKEFDKIVNGK